MAQGFQTKLPETSDNSWIRLHLDSPVSDVSKAGNCISKGPCEKWTRVTWEGGGGRGRGPPSLSSAAQLVDSQGLGGNETQD